MSPYRTSPITVLFLCTGNSARSILGEALVNALGAPNFCGLSAGSKPAGEVNPGALRLLRSAGIAANDLYSKSWDVFADGPDIDIVITVCDNAAGESCPLFRGNAVRCHWGIPDPAGAADEKASFERAYDVISRRVARLVALPVDELDDDALAVALNTICEDETY